MASIVFLSSGPGHFAPLASGSLGADVRAAADLDGDGRLELIALADGQAVALNGKGTKPYGWQAIRPKAATATGDQRINSFGVGGSVEVRTGRISTSDRPFLEIVDCGPGIALADAERIFEPFFTGSKGGTGLGLFIARELAQCNRAALIYEPRSGGGSVFRVVFADPQRWEL